MDGALAKAAWAAVVPASVKFVNGVCVFAEAIDVVPSNLHFGVRVASMLNGMLILAFFPRQPLQRHLGLMTIASFRINDGYLVFLQESCSIENAAETGNRLSRDEGTDSFGDLHKKLAELLTAAAKDRHVLSTVIHQLPPKIVDTALCFLVSIVPQEEGRLVFLVHPSESEELLIGIRQWCQRVPVGWNVEFMRKASLVGILQAECGWPLGKALWIIVEGIAKVDIMGSSNIQLLNFSSIHDDIVTKAIFDDPLENQIPVESLKISLSNNSVTCLLQANIR